MAVTARRPKAVSRSMALARLIGGQLRVGRADGLQLLLQPVRLAAPVTRLACFLARGAAPFALVQPGGGAADQQAEGKRAKQEQKERRLQRLSLIHISEPTRRTPISYAVF